MPIICLTQSQGLHLQKDLQIRRILCHLPRKLTKTISVGGPSIGRWSCRSRTQFIGWSFLPWTCISLLSLKTFYWLFLSMFNISADVIPDIPDQKDTLWHHQKMTRSSHGHGCLCPLALLAISASYASPLSCPHRFPWRRWHAWETPPPVPLLRLHLDHCLLMQPSSSLLCAPLPPRILLWG